MSTDKEEYIIPENADLKIDLTLQGNKIKKYNSPAEMSEGKLNNMVITPDGHLQLQAQNITEPINLIKNGDFANNLNDWKLQQGNSYITTSSLDGTCALLCADYYSSTYPHIYQDIQIPANITEAKLSLIDQLGDYASTYAIYRIDIKTPEDKLVKNVFSCSGFSRWDRTSREFDLKEFAGKTIRLDFSINGPGNLYLDNIALNVVQSTYSPSGTANYIIDAGQTAIWDKLKYTPIFVSKDNLYFKVRSSDLEAGLSMEAWSEEMTADNSLITVKPGRFLELEVRMNSSENEASPVISDLQVTYVSYTEGDNLRIKVLLKDSDGDLQREYADINPLMERGREQTFHLTFATNHQQPGPYQVTAALYAKGTKAASAKDDFVIIEGQIKDILDGRITTDKIEYAGGDTARITSRVMNKSTATNLKNLQIDVTITDENGTPVKTYTYAIANLIQSSLNDKPLVFEIGRDLSLGTYKVTQKASLSGEEVFTRTATFIVKSNVEQGTGLVGTVTPQPMIVKRRVGDLALATTAQNTGNTNLTGVVFKVTIFEPTTLAELKVLSSTATALPKEGPGCAETQQYGSKVELMPGTYPVSLKAEVTVNGVTKVIPLDTNAFTVTNSAPAANAGADQILEAAGMDKNTVILDGSGSTDENSTDANLKNDIVKYEWTLGGKVIGTSEQPNVILPIGVHVITLTVTDSCGATGTDTVQITIRSTSKPVIKELAPAHETITRELDGIGATVEDKISGINYSTLAMTLMGNPLTATYNTETGRVSASFPADSADGWYDLALTISNNMGISATTPEWKVGLDRTPPIISELTPEADVYSQNATPIISAKVTDAFAGIEPSSIKVSIGETVLEAAYDAATGKVTAAVPDALANGWYNAKIEVCDKVGNSNSATWRVGVDITPPTVSNMTPSADSEISQAAQEISAILTDELSGIDVETISVKVDGAVVTHTFNETTGKVSYEVTDLSSGSHSVDIAVSDNAGNPTSTTWQFNVQLQIPGSEYLLFHNSKSGQLDISGGNKQINGVAHSNASIKIRGNHTTITGKTTAVNSISVKGKDHDVAFQQSNAAEVPIPVYPYEWYVNNATQVHEGSWNIGKGQNVPAGIHLVNGDVTIQGDINAGITIVATGNITVKSQTVKLMTADGKYRMALYSRDGNISFSSNGVTVTGVIYAPKGECKVSSNGSTFVGAVVADTVDFSGQNLTLSPLNYEEGGAQ